MKIKIKKLNPNAEIPSKACEGDFCYDVKAVSKEEIAPGVFCYGIGLAFEIERDSTVRDDAVLCISARPRSSIYKTGLILANCVGTIDEGYRGEVKFIFYHVMPEMPEYNIGDKIGQIHLDINLPIDFELVTELSDSERNEGGFGHSGK